MADMKIKVVPLVCFVTVAGSLCYCVVTTCDTPLFSVDYKLRSALFVHNLLPKIQGFGSRAFRDELVTEAERK
jgi:hypothetical protein